MGVFLQSAVALHKVHETSSTDYTALIFQNEIPPRNIIFSKKAIVSIFWVYNYQVGIGGGAN